MAKLLCSEEEWNRKRPWRIVGGSLALVFVAAIVILGDWRDWYVALLMLTVATIGVVSMLNVGRVLAMPLVPLGYGVMMICAWLEKPKSVIWLAVGIASLIGGVLISRAFVGYVRQERFAQDSPPSSPSVHDN